MTNTPERDAARAAYRVYHDTAEKYGIAHPLTNEAMEHALMCIDVALEMNLSCAEDRKEAVSTFIGPSAPRPKRGG